MRSRSKRSVRADPIELVVLVGVSIAALAHLVLAIEVIEWVATGQWPGWSVEDGMLLFGIEEPTARFDATQFLLDIATDLPLALGLYLGGLLIYFAAISTDPEDGAGREAHER